MCVWAVCVWGGVSRCVCVGGGGVMRFMPLTLEGCECCPNPMVSHPINNF